MFLVLCIATSCERSDDGIGNAQEEKGWIEILNNETVVVYKGETGSIDVDVNIQVPTTSSELAINYDLVSVSGTWIT